MDRLPLELLAEICHHLPQEDIPNYRLVGRAFAAVATQQLFRGLIFHASNASFERVRAVSAHPIFRDYVKNLIWDANVYNRGIDTFDDWKGIMSSDPGFISSDGESSDNKDDLRAEKYMNDEIQLRQQFTIYQQKVREEADVMDHLLKGATAAHVFGLLKNVTQLIICNGPFGTTRDHVWMIEPDRERRDPRIRNGNIITRGIHTNRFDIANPTGSKALISGINSMGCHLVSLMVFDVSCTAFHPTVLPDDLASHLPKLKLLQLHIETEDRGSCYNILKLGCLKSFIGGLKSLEELVIKFDDNQEATWKNREVRGACFDDVISLNIKGLSSVEFQFMGVTESRFIAFLLNNAKTLRSMRLTEVCFDNETIWQKVLNTIRSDLHLRSIYIGGELLMEQFQYGVDSCDWLEIHVVESPWLEYRIIHA